MNRNEEMREVRKGGLILAKSLAAVQPERIVCDGKTGEDVLRIFRNRIWDKYGPDELAELEAEIDLGL